jgi:hypothetical protein
MKTAHASSPGSGSRLFWSAILSENTTSILPESRGKKDLASWEVFELYFPCAAKHFAAVSKSTIPVQLF